MFQGYGFNTGSQGIAARGAALDYHIRLEILSSF